MADKSKQELVIELVQKGEFTREEIKDQVECTAGSLASYLSTMSNIAKFTDAKMHPVTDEDGILSVATYAEAQEAAEARRAARPAAASKKSPAERHDAADKRMLRCTNALASAVKRADASPDDHELNLRKQAAAINLQIAEIEMERATENYSSAAEDSNPETEDELL